MPGYATLAMMVGWLDMLRLVPARIVRTGTEEQTSKQRSGQDTATCHNA